MKTQSSFLIYLLQNNIKYLVLAKNQSPPRRLFFVPQNSVKQTLEPERSTVPRRGALPPPSRGLSQLTAPAPSGAGAEAEGRAGSGGCAPKYYIELGAKKKRTCTTWVVLTQCYLYIRALIGFFLEKIY